MKNAVLFLLILLVCIGCSKDDDSTQKEGFVLTIHYSAGLGSVDVEPLMERYPKGTLVKMKAIANNGASFKDWTMNATIMNQKEIVFSVDSDTEITAHFIANEQKNFSLVTSCEATQGAITVSPAMESYPMGTTVQIAAAAKEGYKFSRWEGISSTDAMIQMDMTANFNLKAIFVNNDGTAVASSDVLFSMDIQWDKDESWIIESELTYEKTSKEISGAVIKVNNSVLIEDGFFKGNYDGTIESLTPGQKVTVTVQYNQLPVNTFEIIVPPAFTTSPALKGNLKDGVVTLNWEKLDCNGYVLHKSIENTEGSKAEIMVNDGSLLADTSYTATANAILSGFIELSPPAQYFTLWVCPATSLSNLQGFHTKSYIWVVGKKSNEASNKPKS